jgi:hypothetical protein
MIRKIFSDLFHYNQLLGKVLDYLAIDISLEDSIILYRPGKL